MIALLIGEEWRGVYSIRAYTVPHFVAFVLLILCQTRLAKRGSVDHSCGGR